MLESNIEEQGEQVIAKLKGEFPTLAFQFMNNAICVRMPGCWVEIASKSDGWTVNEKVQSLLPNYVIFKHVESELIAQDPDTRGAYLEINGPCSRFLHETFDSAWRSKYSDLSFVGRIGTEDSSDEVLALSDVEKPTDFETLRR